MNQFASTQYQRQRLQTAIPECSQACGLSLLKLTSRTPARPQLPHALPALLDAGSPQCRLGPQDAGSIGGVSKQRREGEPLRQVCHLGTTAYGNIPVGGSEVLQAAHLQRPNGSVSIVVIVIVEIIIVVQFPFARQILPHSGDLAQQRALCSLKLAGKLAELRLAI